LHTIRCEGRGGKDVFWKLLKNGAGEGGKGIRANNGGGWMDQSKVYPQWAYIEAPLWIST
jgi:hypothetical protein